MYGWWLIRLNSKFVSKDQEPPVVNIFMDDVEIAANFDYVLLCFLL